MSTGAHAGSLRRWAIPVCVLVLGSLMTCAITAHAMYRPGGGSSFSGGSRSSSSSSRSSSSSSSSRSSSSSGSSFGSSSSSSFGSSSSSSRSSSSAPSSGAVGVGDVGLLWFLLRGAAGTVVVIVLLLIIVGYASQRAAVDRRGNWQSAAVPEPRAPRIGPLLERLRERDPNFSRVLLEDFVYALYAQTHTLRGSGALDRLSAYLRPPALAALGSLGPVSEVRSIVIGAMRYLDVDGLAATAPAVLITIELESNYTEIAAGREQSFYACERWQLARAPGVLSRTPERVRVFACPSCGAPLDAMVGGRCNYCQATVDNGQFDWIVNHIELVSREARGPLLTGTTEETGTELPTVVDPDVHARWNALTQRDPSFAWPALQARVALIFTSMQVAWSNREWPAARPFVTDNLFQMLAYWIETYRRAELRNITEGARIERMEVARVSSDKFYDALTIRLYASSLDYTVRDSDGRVVGGDRGRPRRYSEYWTLVRSAGRSSPARSDPNCPSCGAPLRIEMAGVCAYCRAKVTSGDFDWVLSRIEQDEVYGG